MRRSDGRQGGTAQVVSWPQGAAPPVRGFGLHGEVRLEDFLRDGAYVLRTELPGIDPERDLEVYVEADTLVVRGARHGPTGPDTSPAHHETFERVVALPRDAQREHVTARFTDGALEVHVPLDDGSRRPPRRRIPVERGAD